MPQAAASLSQEFIPDARDALTEVDVLKADEVSDVNAMGKKDNAPG